MAITDDKEAAVVTSLLAIFTLSGQHYRALAKIVEEQGYLVFSSRGLVPATSKIINKDETDPNAVFPVFKTMEQTTIDDEMQQRRRMAELGIELLDPAYHASKFFRARTD